MNTSSEKLRFAVLGCGFWANYQIPAWFELEGIQLVALYNRTLSKAQTLAQKYAVPRCYDNVDQLLDREQLDFVDIITDVDTHPVLVEKAASRGVTVICQKPMGPSWPAAKRMMEVCEKNRVPFFIHENWRWQTPIRKVKEILDSGVIGRPFKGKISCCHAYPVFENQPFLAELEEMVIADMGSHLFDVSRFLFGEASLLYAQTTSVHPNIKGEDVANVLITHRNGVQSIVEISFASIYEREPFPQSFVSIEGSQGSITLGFDCEIRTATRQGTGVIRAEPILYPWLNPDYTLVHASIVDCNRDILQALQGRKEAETTGKDNLETMRLVYAAYESARHNRVVNIAGFH